jgi:hypothetical protein
MTALVSCNVSELYLEIIFPPSSFAGIVFMIWWRISKMKLDSGVEDDAGDMLLKVVEIFTERDDGISSSLSEDQDIICHKDHFI